MSATARSETAQALLDLSVSHEVLLVACQHAYTALVRLSPVVQQIVARELTEVRTALSAVNKSSWRTKEGARP